ncbi:hypothetical protein HPP92_010550 [Vanilla planifolia]|uniref:PHD-type domain-containing protein n=1 Tax=Vanilla planifolia TaxID=51239 RepID=A0A835QZ40_VANPL|nr:hypothetical protein HPP92_010790 [Vanilla planifolia]KAG0482466.1 hypothetical protein HPP92_010550 [Vanilla planifolia]
MHKEALCFEDPLTRPGDKLTQGSVSVSISTGLSFELGNGNSKSMNSSFNWLNSGENWQKSARPDVYRLLSCKSDACIGKSDNISTGIAGISGACYSFSTTNNMCASSTPLKNGFVYKRRKTQKKSVALLSGKTDTEVSERSIIPDFNLGSVDDHLAPPQKHFNDVPVDEEDHSGKNIEMVLVREAAHSAKRPIINLCNLSAGNCNVSCPSPEFRARHGTLSAVAAEHDNDCASSFAIPSESLKDFTSSKEMCIYVLRRHGLLGGTRKNRAGASFESMGSREPMVSQCRICKLTENALKMLICDDCEQAYHLSCCKPKVKKLPVDEWYCQSCFKKKRKHLLSTRTSTSSGIMCDVSEHGPILSMLRDIRPHRSRVRIGGDFQVDVLDWSGSIDNYDGYFSEPKEIDHADCYSLEGL